jgi:hypothetical protein
MPNESVRQAARRAALDAQTQVRRRDEERDKRRSRLGVIVVTALAQRDEQIRVFELRAGEALNALIADEGLAVGEAAEWCGLPVKEVRRLRRLFLGRMSCPTRNRNSIEETPHPTLT